MRERPESSPPREARGTLSPGPHPRVLVIKLATLGDLLLATPALRALRRRYPDAEIDVLTTQASAALLGESPLVDRIYTVDKYAFDTPGQLIRRPWRLLGTLPLLARLRARRYDVVLLMHHLTLRFGTLKYRAMVRAIGARHTAGLDNGRGGFLDVPVADAGFGALHEAEYDLAVAEAVGATLPRHERGPRLADLGWALDDQSAPEAGARRVMALHPGSGTYSVARRWPAGRFAAVAQALHEEWDAEIALVGTADEWGLRDDILRRLGRPSWAYSAEGPTSPRALAELLSQCLLFVGNDSFPMHLAAAARTPVVAIFGPSNARAWGPYAPDAPNGRERVAVVPTCRAVRAFIAATRSARRRDVRCGHASRSWGLRQCWRRRGICLQPGMAGASHWPTKIADLHRGNLTPQGRHHRPHAHRCPTRARHARQQHLRINVEVAQLHEADAGGVEELHERGHLVLGVN
jgi:ADP-heptose:LPS heptosyltransferase